MHRLGVVSFTNTFPLVEGLDQQAGVQLIRGTPRALAGMLHEGALDAAIAPIAEHLLNPGRYQILPGVCIGCRGEVQSVRLYSRQPQPQISRILADPASMSSNLLTRVMLRENHGLEPEMVECSDRPAFERRLADPATEAAVVIGDLALRLHNGIFKHSFAHSLDLGQAWLDMTGLPFVFAVWLAPIGAPAQPLAALLNEARDAGLRRLPAMAARAARETGLPVEICERYYERNVTYHLDEEHRRGLARFEAAAHNLLEIESA